MRRLHGKATRAYRALGSKADASEARPYQSLRSCGRACPFPADWLPVPGTRTAASPCGGGSGFAWEPGAVLVLELQHPVGVRPDGMSRPMEDRVLARAPQMTKLALEIRIS